MTSRKWRRLVWIGLDWTGCPTGPNHHLSMRFVWHPIRTNPAVPSPRFIRGLRQEARREGRPCLSAALLRTIFFVGAATIAASPPGEDRLSVFCLEHEEGSRRLSPSSKVSSRTRTPYADVSLFLVYMEMTARWRLEKMQGHATDQ